MDAQRKLWNDNQRLLQEKLPKAADFEAARSLLLRHHAMVHGSALGAAALPSFEDEAWSGLTEANARLIPHGQEHSIVWVMWHIARVEDVTMNMLIADCAPVFDTDNWRQRLNAPFQDTGNSISDEKMHLLNTSVDVAALKAYRLAVGQRTQAIIQSLRPEMLPQKVAAVRIQKLRESGAVVETAYEIIDYWSKRTTAGLLLMPATRHNFVHLNEAQRIKQALRKSS